MTSTAGFIGRRERKFSWCDVMTPLVRRERSCMRSQRCQLSPTWLLSRAIILGQRNGGNLSIRGGKGTCDVQSRDSQGTMVGLSDGNQGRSSLSDGRLRPKGSLAAAAPQKYGVPHGSSHRPHPYFNFLMSSNRERRVLCPSWNVLDVLVLYIVAWTASYGGGTRNA